MWTKTPVIHVGLFVMFKANLTKTVFTSKRERESPTRDYSVSNVHSINKSIKTVSHLDSRAENGYGSEELGLQIIFITMED